MDQLYKSNQNELKRVSHMELVAGANTAVPTGVVELKISIIFANASSQAVDVSAYALSEQTQKVRGDDDMIFYGQRQNAAGSIALVQQDAQHNLFRLNLAQVDAAIGKIAFSATLEHAHLNFASIRAIEIQILQQQHVVAQARIQGAGRTESALILGEFYRRQGQWKFRLIDQGFAGGLKPLAEHFGVDIAADSAPPAKPTPMPAAPVAPPPPKISLQKISLDKNNRQVSLEKKGSSFGEIRINLNWNRAGGAAPAAGGFFSKLFQQNKGIDLDLGCLYELQDGERALVQALGDRFGDYQRAPYIQLSGDDRTGAVQDGEWMRINGEHWSKIKRLIVYAFIYEGAPNWAATDGVVTIYVPNQPPIEIALTEGSANKGLCGVVLLENRAGAIHVSREVRYFSSQKPLDEHYGWGLRWVAGSKD
jgi:tellurite resistance protein TerA